MLYAVIKKYATYKNENGDNLMDWHFRSTSCNEIYQKMMEITENDHEISDEASSWCETATEGEIYEFREGEIEIQDIP